jgi:MFS family permease
MRPRPDATRTRSRTGVAATFATHAAIAGTLGPWVPTLKADARLDAGDLGLALAGYAAGLVLGTRLADPMMRALGARGVVRTAIPALALAFGSLPFAGDLASLAMIFVLVGTASGIVDVAMNAEAVAVEESLRRPIMSSLHGIWSVAVLAAAGAAALAVALGARPGWYLPAAAVGLALASWTPLRWLPERATAHDVSPGDDTVRVDRVGIALLCATAAGSFLAEGVALEWSAVLLREGVGAAAGTAGLGVVAFSAGMATSRFAGDRAGARFGRAALARLGASIGAAALAGALLVGRPPALIAAFAVLGLGLGTVVPAAFGAAGRIARSRGRTALAIVVTAGYVGSIVGPLVVGFVADRAGLRAAFTIPVAAALVAALTLRTPVARAGT